MCAADSVSCKVSSVCVVSRIMFVFFFLVEFPLLFPNHLCGMALVTVTQFDTMLMGGLIFRRSLSLPSGQ